MIATGAGVAHAQRGGHGGFVGRPGGGSPRPSGGSPSFSRPTSNPSANGFSRPANSSSLGERPSFGGIGNTNRLNPSGNFVGQRPAATTRPSSAGAGLGVAGRPGTVNVGNTVVNRTAIGGNTVVNRNIDAQNITNTGTSRTSSTRNVYSDQPPRLCGRLSPGLRLWWLSSGLRVRRLGLWLRRRVPAQSLHGLPSRLGQRLLEWEL